MCMSLALHLPCLFLTMTACSAGIAGASTITALQLASPHGVPGLHSEVTAWLSWQISRPHLTPMCRKALPFYHSRSAGSGLLAP